MTDLADKVIAIWYLVYDEDANQSYECGSFEKALASIEASMRGFLGSETQQAETLYSAIVEEVAQRRDQAYIPMRIKSEDNVLFIALYYWELTAVHPVHKVLQECHSQVGPELRAKIEGLFSKPRV